MSVLPSPSRNVYSKVASPAKFDDAVNNKSPLMLSRTVPSPPGRAISVTKSISCPLISKTDGFPSGTKSFCKTSIKIVSPANVVAVSSAAITGSSASLRLMVKTTGAVVAE